MKRLNEAFNRKILKFRLSLFPHFIFSLFFAIALFVIGPMSPDCYAQEGRLRIHFIDVGYGDAIFIQFPDSRTMMIDSGEKHHTLRLMSYLQSLDIQKIDQAVITHPHKNHFGGFFDILKSIPIDQLFINGDKNAEEGYEELLQMFRDRQIPIKKVSRGMTLNNFSESVNIEVLHPKDLSSNTNDNSIVLWLKYREISILFMADIGLAEQARLISLNQEIEQVNSIKVPHHGGPLSDEFIRLFTGKKFIISTGTNPWGLPREHDLQRLRGTIYRTDRQGTVVLESDGFSTSIKVVGAQGS